MQLTKHTDFGLRVLIYLAHLPPQTQAQIGEISQALDISRNHLAKVVNRLGRLGYVETIRGRGGGLRLGQAPETIRLGRLIRELEPNLTPINCHEPRCALLPSCTFQSVLGKAMEAFLQVLDEHTLVDIVKNPSSVEALQTITWQS